MSGAKSQKWVHQNPANQWSNSIMKQGTGEILVFLRCPDVDPMHSHKIRYSFCSQ